MVGFIDIPGTSWGRWLGFYAGGKQTSNLCFSALRKAVRNPDGYRNRICNFLPVKIMSYVMLPVESAIAVVQR